ncbi:hypothetical protein BJ980_002125 [Nocardioides daedukensis]|uniref:Uncharacterized protein n=1 Tax=Nocardioides daedukensis TaxID=634462 RepID=A0A7Y9UQE8_9ACTN|nr:hypothetical protein [Nocardioides daedukensis]NYG59202.1 hypothetical protein [Nocardioides daedukensis]
MRIRRFFSRPQRALLGPAPDYYACWMESLRDRVDTVIDTYPQTGRMMFHELEGSSLAPPVLITITPEALNQYVANMIRSDGTVYGRAPKNEAPETDTHQEALTLFRIHLDEFLFTNDGPGPGPWRLDPARFMVPA